MSRFQERNQHPFTLPPCLMSSDSVFCGRNKDGRYVVATTPLMQVEYGRWRLKAKPDHFSVNLFFFEFEPEKWPGPHMEPGTGPVKRRLRFMEMLLGGDDNQEVTDDAE